MNMFFWGGLVFVEKGLHSTVRRKKPHQFGWEGGNTLDGFAEQKRGIVDNVALVPALPGRLMM